MISCTECKYMDTRNYSGQMFCGISLPPWMESLFDNLERSNQSFEIFKYVDGDCFCDLGVRRES